MENINTENKPINPDKWYSAFEISAKKLLPMEMSMFILKKHAEAGRLKATIYNTEAGKRYLIKGENLIKFIAKYEAGDFHN